MGNMPEVIRFVAFLAFGCPIPLTPLLLLCMDLGTDIMPSISLAMETKEMDIMKRQPRDPKHDKLGTIKLIFNAEAIFGIFSAFAGLFAFFSVLNSYGFLPSHLTDGIARNYVFSNSRKEEDQRDAYYLWCFDPDWTTKCQYLPNFYKHPGGSVPHTFHGNAIPYYDGYQFYEWQMNQDDSHIYDGYALQAKKFLVATNNKENNQVTTGTTNPLTMNQLNGNDQNGVKCPCNPFQIDGVTTDATCTNSAAWTSTDCDNSYL